MKIYNLGDVELDKLKERVKTLDNDSLIAALDAFRSLQLFIDQIEPIYSAEVQRRARSIIDGL